MSGDLRAVGALRPELHGHPKSLTGASPNGAPEGLNESWGSEMLCCAFLAIDGSLDFKW